MTSIKTPARPQKTKIEKETYLGWYEMMLLIRRFEEKAGQMYGMQKIRGFLHLYIGQEAAAVGLLAAITPSDPVITAYRDHGIALARGVSPESCMAELFGKATGCTGGKGGSMHFFSKEKYFFGGHGIVGGQIPLGTGMAFAEKYNNTGKIVVCMFGDGAAWQGALHESLNLASVWQLPVVYVCENNQYAMGTAVKRSTRVTEIHKLCQPFGIKALAADGMDVMEVYSGMKEAADYTRKTGAPSMVELNTYRYKGHSMSDPARYRTKEELQSYKEQDPLELAQDFISKNRIASAAELEGIQEKVRVRVEESVKFAEESPFPQEEELYSHIYNQDNYPFIKD